MSLHLLRARQPTSLVDIAKRELGMVRRDCAAAEESLNQRAARMRETAAKLGAAAACYSEDSHAQAETAAQCRLLAGLLEEAARSVKTAREWASGPRPSLPAVPRGDEP